MKLHKTLLASGAAVVLLISSQAALATSTVSVGGTTTPAADVGFTAPSVGGIDFLTDFGVPASCTGGTISGTIKRGTSATSGTQIGTISSLSFATGCTSTSLAFPFVMTNRADKPAWRIFLDGTPAQGATTINVEIRNIYAQIRDAARTAPNLRYAANLQGNVSGTAGATVKAQIRLNQSGTTDYLVINTPALGTTSLQYPLIMDALDTFGDESNTANTSTFGGEIVDGDRMSLVGSFALNQQVAIG